MLAVAVSFVCAWAAAPGLRATANIRSEISMITYDEYLAAGGPLRGAAGRAAAAATGPAAAADLQVMGVVEGSVDTCLLLPDADYPGEKPRLVGGEMELQEMEDNMESRTQIFLNADGSVSLGATDGPPPEDSCGYWQCGSDAFQMTLMRVFNSDQASLIPNPDNLYTVTRVYTGNVEPRSSGVAIVEGRMALAGTDLSDAIGFFVLDANMLAVGEGGEMLPA